ncbi:hypothetical protein TNCV_411521 [Trichonephila clavipes]|nr:hypothetical protein TNCV_411521 [Trichonephila clavipes]
MDLVILKNGQMTRATHELAPPLLTTTPHQREDISALDRFNVHRCPTRRVAAVAEWYRHRIVAGFVTSSSPVPLKTRRVGQRCTLNLSRAETSSVGVCGS